MNRLSGKCNCQFGNTKPPKKHLGGHFVIRRIESVLINKQLALQANFAKFNDQIYKESLDERLFIPR